MPVDTAITFTPAELVAVVLGACGLITAVAAAGASLYKVWQWLRKPNTEQDRRLAAHDAKLAEHDRKLAAHDGFFANDKRRIDGMENGNKVTQKAILALLAHAIDGNNMEQMEDARDDLQSYLVNK